MPTHNAENERIKREYLIWLREAQGASEATLDAAAAALHRFETHTRFRSFKSFRPQQATAFKRWLGEQVNAATGELLSKATLHAVLKNLRMFFEWLSREPGFRSHVNYSDAGFFRLSENEARIARATRATPTPSLEQIERALQLMPTDTVIQRRDRAVLAFSILTGARDDATVSFRLGHVDFERDQVVQDARVVRTKRRKTFTTTFFPVGMNAREIVAAWVEELRRDHLFGPDDPLFPATRIVLGESGQFERAGLDRKPWSGASPVRRIFRQAFEAAGLPYFNPHSFRRTLALLGQRLCATPEAYKAWSQNLGHAGVLTTFTSYGTLPHDRQAEIIRSLGQRPDDGGDVERLAADLLAAVRRRA